MEIWNSLHNRWPYKDVRNFYRDAKRALTRIGWRGIEQSEYDYFQRWLGFYEFLSEKRKWLEQETAEDKPKPKINLEPCELTPQENPEPFTKEELELLFIDDPEKEIEHDPPGEP